MPSTEQKHLVVHVLVETAVDYNNASGIVVAPGRVLTAAHVLDGAVGTPEIRLCELKPDDWIPAQVRWDGRGHGRDVAVLEFDSGKLDATARGICELWSRFLINTGPWGSHVRWGSYGLPGFGWRTPRGGGKPIPKPTGLVGNTGAPNPSGDLDLVADTIPSAAGKWMGASGSGVFIDHGLRAIIIEAVPEAANMLRALWIRPLLELSGFSESINWSAERDWLRLLINKVVDLLSGTEMKPLRDLLAGDLGVESRDAAHLAGEWFAQSSYHFLMTANRVGEALVGDGSHAKSKQEKRMAGVVEEIVEVGLAGKLGGPLLSRVGLRARAGEGEGVLPLPCMEIVLVDYYNAGMDGRRVVLERNPPANGEGIGDERPDWFRASPVWPRFCYPLGPVLGFDRDPTLWVRTALRHLAEAVKIPESRRSSETTEALAKSVNTRLETLAKVPDQLEPRRWYLLYPEREDAAPAQALKQLLPQLRICTFGRSSDEEEAKEEDRLAMAMADFLERKGKREKKR